MSHTDVTSANGWSLYGHPAFLGRLQALLVEVEHLEVEDPEGFQSHPCAKLLASVFDAMMVRVPADPNSRDFTLGKTIGKGRGHWRRVKKGMPPRYRLFFQFRSEAPKSVIFVWLNDEQTLRKAGSKTDVYAVFEHMLEAGKMPDSFSDLVTVCRAVPERA